MNFCKFFRAALTSAMAFIFGGDLARAQESEPFSGGKPLTVLIGFGPGGGYDLWGRLLARHMGKYLPGRPNGVPQNMPGAGSLTVANYIYSVAPNDGSVIGIFARDAALAPLTGQPGSRFDPLKMSWIGSPTVETNVCIANGNARAKSISDLKQTELIVGDIGPGTGTRAYPLALADILGFKFKLVAGFPSSVDVFLAMERGEVEGICESLDSVLSKRPAWISSKVVNVLFQGGATPNPGLADVPYIVDLATTQAQRDEIRFLYAGQGIGRPFVAPPDLPAARLTMLRTAFDKVMKDPEALDDARKQKLDIDPRNGAQLQSLVESIYATPRPIVERIGALIK
jgi:tripartite-type tricarboxylate transporter receptor subunit TctC